MQVNDRRERAAADSGSRSIAHQRHVVRRCESRENGRGHRNRHRAVEHAVVRTDRCPEQSRRHRGSH